MQNSRYALKSGWPADRIWFSSWPAENIIYQLAVLENYSWQNVHTSGWLAADFSPAGRFEEKYAAGSFRYSGPHTRMAVMILLRRVEGQPRHACWKSLQETVIPHPPYACQLAATLHFTSWYNFASWQKFLVSPAGKIIPAGLTFTSWQLSEII